MNINRRAVEVLILVAAVAWLALQGYPSRQPRVLSIGGVSLGMAREIVDGRLGPPQEVVDDSAVYAVTRDDILLNVEYSADRATKLVVSGSKEQPVGGLITVQESSTSEPVVLQVGMSRKKISEMLQGCQIGSNVESSFYKVKPALGIEVTFHDGLAEEITGPWLELDGKRVVSEFGTIDILSRAFGTADIVTPDAVSYKFGGESLGVLLSGDKTVRLVCLRHSAR